MRKAGHGRECIEQRAHAPLSQRGGAQLQPDQPASALRHRGVVWWVGRLVGWWSGWLVV